MLEMEILQEVFYGNTVLAWATSLSIILLSILLGNAIYWIF